MRHHQYRQSNHHHSRNPYPNHPNHPNHPNNLNSPNNTTRQQEQQEQQEGHREGELPVQEVSRKRRLLYRFYHLVEREELLLREVLRLQLKTSPCRVTLCCSRLTS